MTSRIVGVVGIWAVLFLGFMATIHVPYVPHAICWNYDVSLISAVMGSNLAIAISYLIISVVLWIIDNNAKLRHKHFIFAGFASFIWFCGLTHITDILTVWFPWYWLDVGVRWLTAIPSVIVAIYMITKRNQIIAVVRFVRDNWEEVTKSISVPSVD